MHPTSEAHALISALGLALGEASLRMDEEGLAFLPLSNEFFLHLQADDQRQCFIAFAVVGSLPLQPPVRLLKKLLQANRFWRETAGATLSLDSEQPPRLVLADRYDWTGLDAEEFTERVNQFVDILHEARAWLEEPDEIHPSGWHSTELGHSLA
jgi:hypothetical protein